MRNMIAIAYTPHHIKGILCKTALPTEKGVTMAYTCVLAPSHECDGCQECEQGNRPSKRWDEEYDNDEEYTRYIEREEQSYDR